MNISGGTPARPIAIARQIVAVHTDKGPKDIEVVLAGVMAAVHQAAKPANQGAVLDKKI